jgi:hypothetical protein
LNDIPGFITDLKTTLARFHKIGIKIDNNILTSLVINKFPASLENVSERITQSNEKINPEQLIKLLRMFDNDRKTKSS